MAKKSQRTKDVQKLSKIFFFASFLCFIGVAIFTIIATFSHLGGSEKTGMDILSESVKTQIVSLSITMIIGLVLALIIKEKMRTTIYMLALIVNSILFKEAGMYSILAIWAVDEYVFTTLHKHYAKLTTINKEIDLRG